MAAGAGPRNALSRWLVRLEGNEFLLYRMSSHLAVFPQSSVRILVLSRSEIPLIQSPLISLTLAVVCHESCVNVHNLWLEVLSRCWMLLLADIRDSLLWGYTSIEKQFGATFSPGQWVSTFTLNFRGNRVISAVRDSPVNWVDWWMGFDWKIFEAVH